MQVFFQKNFYFLIISLLSVRNFSKIMYLPFKFFVIGDKSGVFYLIQIIKNLQNPLRDNHRVTAGIVGHACFREAVFMPKMLGLRIPPDPPEPHGIKPDGFKI